MDLLAELRGKAAVSAGSTLAMSRILHRNKTILLDTLTGSVATLPKASGSGARYRFVVSVLATSNSHVVKVGNTTDVMRGPIAVLDSDLATVNNFAFFATTNDDTITLDRTNTGSVRLGEWIEVEDIAAGVYAVRGQVAGAAPATPFSATV